MARNPKEKKPKTTVQKWRTWKRANRALTAAKFAMPAVPFATVLGVNWNDWVGESSMQGWSIGTGFGMLIVATAGAIIGIWKKDDIAKSKVSGVLYIAILFLIVGISFLMLSTIMAEMGKMFLFVAAGLGGSFAIDQVDKAAIKPKVEFYERLVNENGLSASSAKKLDEEEQAKREGREAKKGKVDYL